MEQILVSINTNIRINACQILSFATLNDIHIYFQLSKYQKNNNIMNKKTIKINSTHSIFIIGWFMLFNISISYGQTITFCESVDKYGKAINPADTFDIDTAGSAICILLKPYGPLNTLVVQYEIYSYDENDSLVLNNMLRQDVQKNWLFCWQRLSFKDPGKFKINAYNLDNVLIGTGQVILLIQKE